MSAPVDVLAVMDAIAHSVEQALVPGNDYRRELRAVQQALPEARAAVAELVRNYKEMLCVFETQADLLAAGCKDIPCPRMEARDKYRAALAKVGGAK